MASFKGLLPWELQMQVQLEWSEEHRLHVYLPFIGAENFFLPHTLTLTHKTALHGGKTSQQDRPLLLMVNKRMTTNFNDQVLVELKWKNIFHCHVLYRKAARKEARKDALKMAV